MQEVAVLGVGMHRFGKTGDDNVGTNRWANSVVMLWMLPSKMPGSAGNRFKLFPLPAPAFPAARVGA